MRYEITEKKAAKILGVSVGRVSQLVKDKLLDATTFNGEVRIAEESIVRYQEESRRPGRPSRTSYATASRHMLMNGSHKVAAVIYDSALDEPLSIEEVFDASRAPMGVLTSGGLPKKRELNDWWCHRAIPSSRPGLDGKLLSLGVNAPGNLPIRSMGLSLSDCYWLRPDELSHLSWSEVNFFDNPFVESEPAGWDDWLSGVGLASPDNTSEGELPKKWIADGEGGRFLLKGCRSDDQRPFNEVVATALFRRLLDPADYVAYEIAETADGPAARCANFLGPCEEYVPATYLKDRGGRIRAANNYDRLCRTVGNLGIEEPAVRTALSKMILCDVVLANSDRHWRNFGFIRNIDSLEWRIAPLFDTGNSLWFAKTDAEVERGDWAFRALPFGPDPAGALACIDDLSWFDPTALDGFVEEACDILSASRHAMRPGRLDYIREGLARNIALVCDAAQLLGPRIARGR